MQWTRILVFWLKEKFKDKTYICIQILKYDTIEYVSHVAQSTPHHSKLLSVCYIYFHLSMEYSHFQNTKYFISVATCKMPHSVEMENNTVILQTKYSIYLLKNCFLLDDINFQSHPLMLSSNEPSLCYHEGCVLVGVTYNIFK